MKRIFSLLALFVANILYSQITVTPDGPANLVQNVLIGNGVLVSNITAGGDTTTQYASFTAAPGTPVDFDEGIVLSTFSMTAPNVMQVGGPGYFGAGTAGDADLSTTAGGAVTNNAAWIQFDFIPTGDTMRFDYVFLSTEYNFYVNSAFNDVFAFYLTGPNPVGPAYANQNVAIIPGSPGTPVTINNVNNGQSGGCATGPCSYCTYFIDNCAPPANGIVTGGYTTDLYVEVPVVPCSTYTIKLGVADVTDGALNSAVLIKANSFVSNQVEISTETILQGIDTVVAADSVFYEGCTYTTVSFVRDGNLSMPDTIILGISGTATMGSDYAPFGDTIIFMPGQDTVQIDIIPYEDFLNETMEYVTLTIIDTVCNQPVFQIFTLFISDADSLTYFAGNDTLACPGVLFNFDAQATGGANIFDIIWTDPGSSSFPDDTSLVVTQTGYYDVSFYEFCLDTTVYDSVFIDILQPPGSLPDVLACSDVPINIGTPIAPGFAFSWSPGTNLNDTTITDPTFLGNNPGPGPLIYTYTIDLDSAGYQCFSDTVVVTLHSAPTVDIGDSIQQCAGTLVTIDAGNPGFDFQWNTGDTTQVINPTTGGIYGVTVSIPSTPCIADDSVLVILYPAYDPQLPDQLLCANDSVAIGLSGLPGNNYAWSPAGNIDDNSISNPMFSSPTPGTYTYFLTVDSAGFTCTWDTLVVTVSPDPVVDIGDTTILCENGTVSLDAGNPGSTYQWSTAETTQGITINTPGPYWVVVTNAASCVESDSVMVTFDSLPHFTVDDVTVCVGETASLWVSGSEGDSFLWSTTETDTVIFTTTPGFYTLTVTNNCGSTTDTAEVIFKPDLTSVPLPNVMTPNGDGINDVYTFPLLSEMESFQMDFFDRWGVHLYTTTDINEPWEGTSGNTVVSNGTYYVVIRYFNCKNEEINRTQFITLMR